MKKQYTYEVNGLGVPTRREARKILQGFRAQNDKDARIVQLVTTTTKRIVR